MVVPTLHVGQIVKYTKPLEGEEDLTFVLREHNGDRVLIASLDFPDWRLEPCSVVATEDVVASPISLRTYHVLAVQFEPEHIEQHRSYEASSLTEALAMAEREDAGHASFTYGIEPEDYPLARTEGITFNEADGLLID